jgi:hypothetical protein
MPPKATLAFGAAICQRVWPVFSNGFRRSTNRDCDELAAKFSAAWKCLAGLAASPSPIAPAFEKAIPSDEVARNDDGFFETAGMLYTFADSFDRGWSEGIIYVSDAALSLLENLLYNSLDMEVTAENDLIINSHPMVVRELKRQKADLLDLSKSADRETILSIWARSESERLLD